MLITQLNKVNGKEVNLRIGMKNNPRVAVAQALLKKAGFYTGNSDDDFGPKMQSAVKAFQVSVGFTGDDVDGVLGNASLYKLMWLAYPNFKEREFKCKCGGKYCKGNTALVDEVLLVRMTRVRSMAGRPVKINSGIRCKTWNKVRGGETDSLHLVGKACDYAVTFLSMARLREITRVVFADGGKGINYKTWCHGDTGKARTW